MKAQVPLCLEFANTLDKHASEHPIEELNHYSDLIRWGLEQGILDRRTYESLLSQGREDPRGFGKFLNRAKSIREANYRVFSAISHGRNPATEDLDVLERGMSEAFSAMRLAYHKMDAGGKRFSWEWRSNTHKGELEQILWSVSKSTADLLASEELPRVKECANVKDGCGCLFIDTSRNRTRKWCSMAVCGNREKVRKFRRNYRGPRR